MKQPVALCRCGGQSIVKDSRQTKSATRRRRQCVACGARWTTVEMRVDEAAALPMTGERVDAMRQQLSSVMDELDRFRASGGAC